MKIIFAQGNPEPEYTNTRHNIGFAVLNDLAEQLEATWLFKAKYNAHIAEANFNNVKVLLVKPATFYNETGIVAKKLIDFHKIDTNKDFLAVYDDLALPFGTIRFREKGSDAGNNGVKSLISHLGSDFSRIRIGIHNDHRAKIGDSDFVVAKFLSDEQDELCSHIIPQSINIIENFCQEKTSHISYKTKQ